MTYKDIHDLVDKLVTRRGGEVDSADAFDLAEKICALAYAAQGGPSEDPDINYAQWLAREARNAPAFERLYCKLRDIANDWHCEAKRRASGRERGLRTPDMLDADKAAEITRRRAYDAVTDWDY